MEHSGTYRRQNGGNCRSRADRSVANVDVLYLAAAGRIVSGLVKRIIALLIAAVFLVATQPGSMAMPATSTHTAMQMTNCCGSQETAKCDHGQPMQKHGSPCKDMANCIGMLNCMTFTAISQSQAAVEPHSLTAPRTWHSFKFEAGITLPPDNPPPIV